jgi:hypothetical protein
MKLVLFLLSACAAVVVLASPHNINVARRHAIAARAAVAIPDDALPLQRRQSDNKRCKNRSSSSGSLPATPVVNAVPATQNRATSPTPQANRPSTTTTSSTRPPADTPTPRPTSTTPPSNNNNLPSFMTGVQTGQGTFYDGTFPPVSFVRRLINQHPTAGLGACGITNKDSDFIVAVSWRLFDNYPYVTATPLSLRTMLICSSCSGYNKVNPNTNPICGKRIRATCKQ